MKSLNGLEYKYEMLTFFPLNCHQLCPPHPPPCAEQRTLVKTARVDSKTASYFWSLLVLFLSFRFRSAYLKNSKLILDFKACFKTLNGLELRSQRSGWGLKGRATYHTDPLSLPVWSPLALW